MTKAEQMKVTPMLEDQTADQTSQSPEAENQSNPSEGPSSNGEPFGSTDHIADFDATEGQSEGGAQQEQTIGPDEDFPRASPQIEAVLCSLIDILGQMAAARFKVDPVTPEEATAIAIPAGSLMVQYDVQLDPKTTAWLGLGLGFAFVAGPRYVQYHKIIEGEAKEKKPDDE